MALRRSRGLRALGVPAPGLVRTLSWLAAVLASASLGCAPARDDIVVLAAASLTEAFGELGTAFERAHPAAHVVFSFAGSQTLAMQLRAGADVDVIATANPEIMDALSREGLVRDAEIFATNRLVWIAPPERAPPDAESLVAALPDSDWTIVLAASEVPAGRYARSAIARLGLADAVRARTVSLELDVKGVLAKVQLGEADLGVVYATDVAPLSPGTVTAFDFPPRAQIRAYYLGGIVRSSSDPAAAAAFLDFARGEAGQQILARRGFGGR